MWNMKTLSWILFKIISGNHSDISGPCDLDLWPSDPKINRVHLLVVTNQYVKYMDFVIITFQDNQQKPFWHWRPCDLDLWPCYFNINRGHLLVMTNLYVKYDDFVMNSFQDNMTLKAHVTLTFDLVTTNQKGSLTMYDQSILEMWRLCDN
jgi:hypothetical protein